MPIDKKTPLLLYAAPEQNADMLYATSFWAPDPITFFCHGGRSYLAVSDLELDRAKKQATVDEVLPISPRLEALTKKLSRTPEFHEVLIDLLKELGAREFAVPSFFPVGIADELRRVGFDLHIGREPFFPQRARKQPAEVENIRQAVRAIEKTMAEVVVPALRRATVSSGDRTLALDGAPLTADRLRSMIDVHLMSQGYVGAGTIVAPGIEGIDPHNVGHGPLRESEPIIFDIFPRSLETHYWGDFTRTLCVGQPSAALRRQFQSVLDAQQRALDLLRAGINGRAVHDEVKKVFEKDGYATGLQDGRMQGFFHGTGHGLGLDIHEFPRVSAIDHTLEAGEVVTVEPGLYYAATGGVRLEDVAVITSGGCENLTSYPKKLDLA